MECRTDIRKGLLEHHDSRYNDVTNYLQFSCHTSEQQEPFKLSTLTSPLSGRKSKKDFKALSESSSPYPEILGKITLFGLGNKNPGKKPHNMDLFLDALLRKRENSAYEEEEELMEYKLNFNKQLHRVKYYWRSTSLNYPFTFMRLRSDGDRVICEEDYSNKKVNPNEGLFN